MSKVVNYAPGDFNEHPNRFCFWDDHLDVWEWINRRKDQIDTCLVRVYTKNQRVAYVVIDDDLDREEFILKFSPNRWSRLRRME